MDKEEVMQLLVEYENVVKKAFKECFEKYGELFELVQYGHKGNTLYYTIYEDNEMIIDFNIVIGFGYGLCGDVIEKVRAYSDVLTDAHTLESWLEFLKKVNGYKNARKWFIVGIKSRVSSSMRS